MLPLISSRISSSVSSTRPGFRRPRHVLAVPSRTSLSMPTAEQIWPGVQ